MMKLNKQEFMQVAQYIRQAGDAALQQEGEAAETRRAIAEHDPRLAQMLEDVARSAAQITLYLAERLDDSHLAERLDADAAQNT